MLGLCFACDVVEVVVSGAFEKGSLKGASGGKRRLISHVDNTLNNWWFNVETDTFNNDGRSYTRESYDFLPGD